MTVVLLLLVRGVETAFERRLSSAHCINSQVVIHRSTELF